MIDVATLICLQALLQNARASTTGENQEHILPSELAKMSVSKLLMHLAHLKRVMSHDADESVLLFHAMLLIFTAADSVWGRRCIINRTRFCFTKKNGQKVQIVRDWSSHRSNVVRTHDKCTVQANRVLFWWSVVYFREKASQRHEDSSWRHKTKDTKISSRLHQDQIAFFTSSFKPATRVTGSNSTLQTFR